VKTNLPSLPAATYGVVLLLTAIAQYILAHALVYLHGSDSVVAIAIGRDFKGKVSIINNMAHPRSPHRKGLDPMRSQLILALV